MRRTPIMIMGCTSDAGKSFLVTALCRLLADRGVRVAPFKAQNMSNNAAVTADGLEMGRAQYLQALAARVEPAARMNPILLKPTSDRSSQVIVNGRVDAAIGAVAWMDRKPFLWPAVRAALDGLLAEFDQLVIEGAGSPAEVNLRDCDIVNMSVALACGADVYLVADIDRGGAFAHLLGTWMCLTDDERALVRGFVLNKFRGDPALLTPAVEWLRERTGVGVSAVVPMIPHRLPEEDTLRHRGAWARGRTNVALFAYPYASNLDEFDPLVFEDGVTVVPLRDRTDLSDFQAVILPGTKNTAESLRHLRRTGLADEVMRAAAAGVPVLGVCGGMQMLGRSIADPHGIEGDGEVPGLGLLDVTTTLGIDKTTRQRRVDWDGGEPLQGYEIHHGVTEAGPGVRATLPDGLGWRQGTVDGVYLHGLFENTTYRQAFLDRLGWAGRCGDWRAGLDAEISRVAALVGATGWFPG
jgi:adenosylcobyric acid synthase